MFTLHTSEMILIVNGCLEILTKTRSLQTSNVKARQRNSWYVRLGPWLSGKYSNWPVLPKVSYVLLAFTITCILM